jgi:cytidylate kinase
MADLIVTIDGPAASGKSTAAQLLAEKLGASFLDTGAMYRAVTLAAMQDGVDMSNEDKLLDVLNNRTIQFAAEKGEMTVLLDNVDITKQIRAAAVTANAHYIASAAKLRDRLVKIQRQFAASEKKIVTEGRDQGTVAFPHADMKFYLTAESVERARRRQAELRAKGDNQSLEQIQKDIEERDKSDEARAIGPLRPADDAVVVDTTNLTVEEMAEKLFFCVKEKCLKKN